MAPRYKVGASTDGKAWVVLSDQLGNRDRRAVFPDAYERPLANDRRFVRLTVAGEVAGGDAPAVGEFRVYAGVSN